jgi:hypothetical protein
MQSGNVITSGFYLHTIKEATQIKGILLMDIAEVIELAKSENSYQKQTDDIETILDDTENLLLETADDLYCWIDHLEFDLKSYLIVNTPDDFTIELTCCENCKIFKKNHYEQKSETDFDGICQLNDEPVDFDECCEFYEENKNE